MGFYIQDSIDVHVSAGGGYFKFCSKKKRGGENGCGILCVRVPLRFTHTLLEETLPPTAFAIRPPYQPTENSLEMKLDLLSQ